MAKPETPLLTVDCVAFDKTGRALLITRKNPPFKGQFAIPGGFVAVGETVEAACRRELEEETGAKADTLVFVGVYSQPDRDPRGHTVSIAYTTFLSNVRPKAGDDAARAMWVARWRNLDLAFDHDEILAAAYRAMRLRKKIPPVT